MNISVFTNGFIISISSSFVFIPTCITINLGPLTYTNKSGKTTVFGIVSRAGNRHERPMTTSAFTRVSHPKVLNWINWKTGINWALLKDESDGH